MKSWHLRKQLARVHVFHRSPSFVLCKEPLLHEGKILVGHAPVNFPATSAPNRVEDAIAQLWEVVVPAVLRAIVAVDIIADIFRDEGRQYIATLKRALRLAARWRIINRVPSIELLADENQREFVLSRDQQEIYFPACPEFLRNWAQFALETGMRRKELHSMKWSDIYVDPIGKACRGYVHVRGTKSKNSKRNLSLTAAAQMILLRQRQVSRCEYVFVMDTDPTKPASVSGVNHAHERVRDVLGLPSEFVLHSLRHTFGTRLGEAGADAFTIMRIMGHSTITVSQRYVHPTPETIENALALELATHQAKQKAAEEGAGVATDLATVESTTIEVIH